MALKRQTFDNGTTGEAITVANSATSGDAIGTPIVAGAATATYETTAAIFGAQGCRAVGADTENYQMPLVMTAANASASTQIYFRVDSARTPTITAVKFYRLRSTSADVASLQLTTGLILQLINSAGGGIKNFNNNTALPDGIYCACLQTAKGTGTGDGFISCQIYAENYLTPMDTFAASNVNVGTADITQVFFGKCLTGGGCDIDLDEVSINDGTLTPIDVRWDNVFDPEAGPAAAVTRGLRLG